MTFYLIIVIVSLVLGVGLEMHINHTYDDWSKVALQKDTKTGAQAAKDMLRINGVTHVEINRIQGKLSDNYDPKTNVLNLSGTNFAHASVAALAVACHEAGHAVQHAQGNFFVRLRSALVPVVNFINRSWIILVILGLFFHIAALPIAGVISFAASTLFELVTLPVEFDASRRAVAYIQSAGYDQNTVDGAKKVLRAAAFTYIASAFISVLYLLEYLSYFDND